MAKEKTSKQQKDVLDARREVAFRLERLRESLDREVRWMPKGEKWLKPLMALAVGSAVAMGAPSKRRTRSEPTDEQP